MTDTTTPEGQSTEYRKPLLELREDVVRAMRELAEAEALRDARAASLTDQGENEQARASERAVSRSDAVAGLNDALQSIWFRLTEIRAVVSSVPLVFEHQSRAAGFEEKVLSLAGAIEALGTLALTAHSDAERCAFALSR